MLNFFLPPEWISEMTFDQAQGGWGPHCCLTWDRVFSFPWQRIHVVYPRVGSFPSAGIYHTLCEVICKFLIAKDFRLSNARAGLGKLQPLVQMWPPVFAGACPCVPSWGGGVAQ